MDSVLHTIEQHTGIPPGQVMVFILIWAVVMLVFVVHLVRGSLQRRSANAEPAPTIADLARDTASYQQAAQEMALRNENAPPHVQAGRRHDLRNAYIGFAFFCAFAFVFYSFWTNARIAMDNAKPKRPPANQSP